MQQYFKNQSKAFSLFKLNEFLRDFDHIEKYNFLYQLCCKKALDLLSKKKKKQPNKISMEELIQKNLITFKILLEIFK